LITQATASATVTFVSREALQVTSGGSTYYLVPDGNGNITTSSSLEHGSFVWKK